MDNLFTGRIARLNYFLAGVVLLVILLIFYFIIWGIGSIGLISLVSLLIVGIVNLIVSIVYIIFGFSLTIRRLHDIGWSGLISLFVFIPIVNIVLFFIVLFKRGTEGGNKYGPEPKTNMDILSTLWPSTPSVMAQTQTSTTPTPPPASPPCI